MRNLSIFLLLALFVVACGEGVEEQTFEFTARHDLDNELVNVNLPLDDLSGDFCLEVNGETYPAQPERLTATRALLWWRATQPAGTTVEYTVKRNTDCSERTYAWERVGGQSLKLLVDGRPLIQYEHPVFDVDNIEETKKPFHHVFSPVSDDFITKGPGGLFSHHRGIFFGYNQIEILNQTLDIWHAANGERAEHDEILAEFSGPVMGGHIAKINWKDAEDRIMLEERRDLRAMTHTDDSFFIDFHTRVFAIAAPARLTGDLQHAGVQFRAAQYVADNSDATLFIRPEELSHVSAREELGEEDRINVPWNAMQFTIEGETYTVVYMTHPSNPGRAEMSERLYGRFGEFIPHHMSEGAPVDFRYRFWVVAGEAPSIDEINEQYQRYMNQPI